MLDLLLEQNIEENSVMYSTIVPSTWSHIFQRSMFWRNFSAWTSMYRTDTVHDMMLWYLNLRLQWVFSSTTKNQCRKFETNIPRKEIARPHFPISTFMCLWAIYIPTIDLPILLQEICGVDHSWEYTYIVNRAQTHECGNWDCGRTIPRKGLHKWDFRCSKGTAPLLNQAISLNLNVIITL
jgi:hypothetical protein